MPAFDVVVGPDVFLVNGYRCNRPDGAAKPGGLNVTSEAQNSRWRIQGDGNASFDQTVSWKHVFMATEAVLTVSELRCGTGYSLGSAMQDLLV